MSEITKQAAAPDHSVPLPPECINQVLTFGSLGYKPERICRLLGLRGEKRLALLLSLDTPGSDYYEAYHRGRALGEYNSDAELAKQAERGDPDAIELLEARKEERTELDLRMQLFGV